MSLALWVKVTYLLSTYYPLCPRNSSSELPQFLLWEWQLAQMPRHPFPGVHLCPTNHNTGFTPWRLYAPYPTVSFCHRALKEFSPSSACQTPSSNTGNILHCFQISGAVDRVAFLVLSLAAFSPLRIPTYSYPLTLLRTSKSLFATRKYLIPPRSSTKQNPLSSSSYWLCQEGERHPKWQVFCPAALGLEHSRLTHREVDLWSTGEIWAICAMGTDRRLDQARSGSGAIWAKSKILKPVNWRGEELYFRYEEHTPTQVCGVLSGARRVSRVLATSESSGFSLQAMKISCGTPFKWLLAHQCINLKDPLVELNDILTVYQRDWSSLFTIFLICWLSLMSMTQLQETS